MTSVFRLKAGFYAKGHSGYSDAGSDIVCAAVSALTQGAIGGMQRFGVKCKVYVDDEKGVLCAKVFDERPGKAAIAHVLIESMFHSLKDIQRQFPRNLRIISCDGGVTNDS